MKNIKKQIKQLFSVSKELLNQQLDKYISYIHEKNPYRTICLIDSDFVLCQETYFNKFDVNQSCIKIIQEIYNNILNRYKITKDPDDLCFGISIKEFISKIDYSTLSNYKNFHKFLDILKNNGKGMLFISCNQINSFYQPPIKFGFGKNNNLISDSYYQYIEDLTKNCKNWIEVSQIIINDLINLKNFGRINITVNLLKRSKKQLKITIQHQVTHFLKFLIRINSLNYKYGLYFSNKDISKHQYFDKVDQWKQLATTYIQQLMEIYSQMKIKLKNEQYFQLILKKCKINQNNINIKIDNDTIFKFDQIFQNHFNKNFIIKFFQLTYKNRNNYRNNWKVLKKWFKGQFNKRFKNE